MNNIEYDTKREFIMAKLAQNLKVGKVYMIKINLKAFLLEKPIGFYWLTYKDKETGVTEYIANTGFNQQTPAHISLFRPPSGCQLPREARQLT